MTTFDERETAFENKYAHDAEGRFRMEARANRKLAIWAAGKLDKPAADLDAYIKEVIRADMQEPGAEDVIAKVAADLGAAVSMATVREKYAVFLSEARGELAES